MRALSDSMAMALAIFFPWLLATHFQPGVSFFDIRGPFLSIFDRLWLLALPVSNDDDRSSSVRQDLPFGSHPASRFPSRAHRSILTLVTPEPFSRPFRVPAGQLLLVAHKTPFFLLSAPCNYFSSFLRPRVGVHCCSRRGQPRTTRFWFPYRPKPASQPVARN